MLQGKATIKLSDPKTGRVVHQETHKNNITPALERIFGDNLAGTLDYSKLTPVISKLLGGVCLFNGTVSADDVFLPKASAATLTAHAGQGSGTLDNDPKRGSLNASQSGDIPNGFLWVWEWTTKGNGTITDIVLTHADTGDYWNESTPNVMANFEPLSDVCSHNLASTDYTFVFDGDYSDTPQILNEKKIPIGFIDDENHVVSVEVDYENHRLNVYISKFTGSGAWIWNECGEPYDTEPAIPFNVTHYQWGSWERLGRFMYYLAFDKANKKLYAITIGRPGQTSYLNSWYAKTLYVDELNIATGTTTSYSIDCSATLGPEQPGSETVYVAMWGHSPEGLPLLLKIVEGSVFIPLVATGGASAGALRVNLSNHDDMEIVSGLYAVTGQNQYDLQGAADLGNGRICFCDNFAAQDANGDYIGYNIQRNSNNGSLFGPNSPQMRAYLCEQYGQRPVQYITRLINGTYEGAKDPPRGCVLNKLYAATVYHLDQPVSKTAALTMSVEYSIIEVGGDES